MEPEPASPHALRPSPVRVLLGVLHSFPFDAELRFSPNGRIRIEGAAAPHIYLLRALRERHAAGKPLPFLLYHGTPLFVQVAGQELRFSCDTSWQSYVRLHAEDTTFCIEQVGTATPQVLTVTTADEAISRAKREALLLRPLTDVPDAPPL